jgi:hypothetical protein
MKTVKSADVVQAYNAEKDGVEMSLFVRKNKDDKISNEFYFLGQIKTVGAPNPTIIENTNKAAVEIQYTLHTPIREDLFDYIIS